MKNKKKVLLILCIFIIIIPAVIAADAKPVYKSDVEANNDFLVDGWDRLPFKDIRPLDANYIQWVNDNHGQNWNPTPTLKDKSLSYGAATANDWYRLQTGKTLGTYQNYVNNRTENGTNPRVLEADYFTHSSWEPYYDFAYPLKDPITNEKMAYDIKGYGDIMSGNRHTWVNENDELLGLDYKINVNDDLFAEMSSFKTKPSFGTWILIGPTYKQIKDLMDKYGVLYTQLENVGMLPVHGATLIGYGKFDCDFPRGGSTENVFWVHDTYDTEWNGDQDNTSVRYKCVKAKDVSKVLALYDPSWPFYHYNLRRTGFTLLKGDLL